MSVEGPLSHSVVFFLTEYQSVASFGDSVWLRIYWSIPWNLVRGLPSPTRKFPRVTQLIASEIATPKPIIMFLRVWRLEVKD